MGYIMRKLVGKAHSLETGKDIEDRCGKYNGHVEGMVFVENDDQGASMYSADFKNMAVYETQRACF
jgi:hypothetical protein